ncbi:MAG TPA: helix-turn-helix transcriptional regulator [Patescibacteria group bacterium]|nr:helix-turn-helix transcriptional regulator [Patescibacteria group bacterium]
MKTISDRIKYLRKGVFHLNQKEFGDALGIKNSYISRLEHGSSEPSESLIRLISKTYNVSYDWIKSGIGEYLQDKENLLNSKELTIDCLNPNTKKESVYIKLTKSKIEKDVQNIISLDFIPENKVNEYIAYVEDIIIGFEKMTRRIKDIYNGDEIMIELASSFKNEFITEIVLHTELVLDKLIQYEEL